MAWAGECSVTVQETKWALSQRLGLNYRRELEGMLKTGSALPASKGFVSSLHNGVKRRNMGSGTPCKGGLETTGHWNKL